MFREFKGEIAKHKESLNCQEISGKQIKKTSAREVNLFENTNNKQQSALKTHKCAHCGGRRKTGKDAAKNKSEAWGESDNDGGCAACAGDMFRLKRVLFLELMNILKCCRTEQYTADTLHNSTSTRQGG